MKYVARAEGKRSQYFHINCFINKSIDIQSLFAPAKENKEKGNAFEDILTIFLQQSIELAEEWRGEDGKC